MNDAIEIIEILGKLLAPIAIEMAAALARGEDPLDVLERERIAAILPPETQLELAERRARARLHDPQP